MNRKIILLISLTSLIHHFTFSEIKILCTAALINNQYEMRKQEYITGLKRIKELGYTPLVVESCAQGPTFLDEYATVFYSQTNNARLRNKGVNESISIMTSFPFFNFQDDDIIVVLTGRYYLLSDKLLKIVAEHPDVDIFAKTLPDGQMWTGYWATRFKELKNFFALIDYNWMEKNMVNLERLFAIYTNKRISQGIKFLNIPDLDLRANIFGTGQCELVHF